MRVLITGGRGLLAYWLTQKLPGGMEAVLWDIDEFDLTKPVEMERLLHQIRPAVVINTAAYNLVDRCEIERDLSWAVNAKGPEELARLCACIDAPLVHFSSDYVFDGAKSSPYVETDLPNPLNHYGAGKLHGEQAVLKASPNNLVLRTSWLFGSHPTQAKSYIHSVLRQAQTGGNIKSTTDQVSAPTYAPDLAQWVLDLLHVHAHGLFHAVNDEGVSRYEWTLAILVAARSAEWLGKEIHVEPVLTASFGTTMKRPGYSILSNNKAAQTLGRRLGTWRRGLHEMLAQLGSSDV